MGIYAPAPTRDPPLTLRSRAAGVLVAGRQRAHPGMPVHRGRLAADEIQPACGLWVTTSLRTAFDLAPPARPRRGLVAVDALADRHRFHPDLLLRLSARYRGLRGVDLIPGASPMPPGGRGPDGSRLRMIIVGAGPLAPSWSSRTCGSAPRSGSSGT